MKAEQLKQKFIFDWQPSDQRKSTHNQNFQFELNRLLNEVSRERDQWVAIEFATTYFTLGIPREQVYEYFDEWYDEWKSKQE